MSSQPRAPTKQIRSHIVDPRRPITGTATGTFWLNPQRRWNCPDHRSCRFP